MNKTFQELQSITEAEGKLKIPVKGRDLFATDFRQTKTGPEAKINGEWYSVNGNAQEITDIRYKLSRGMKESFEDMSSPELQSHAKSLSKIARKTNSKEDHLAAAKAHKVAGDRIADKMRQTGQGYSHKLGYHGDMENYHREAARKNPRKDNRPAVPHNPKNDPRSKSYRYTPSYYD